MGGTVKKKKSSNNKQTDQGYQSGHSDVEPAIDAPESDPESSDSDSDDEGVKEGPQLIGGSLGNGIETKTKKGKKRGLDPVGKALATQLIHSKKAKRDIMDAAWNRYMYGDENLPEWFEQDEKKHNQPRIEVNPVSKLFILILIL